jgi:hypothetical protein
MTSLNIPDRPWSTIGVDFVVKLPLSLGFDSILVIVDHYSKGAHMIPANESWKAEDFAFVFFDRFIFYHGLPNKIVLDQGSLFVSSFWKEIQCLLRVKPAPPKAWHPGTNGQTERPNQRVEAYLRHLVSDKQENWVSLLPLAELFFNSSVLESTGFSPFFSQFAFHPRTNRFNNGSDVPAEADLIGSLISIQETLQDILSKAKNSSNGVLAGRLVAPRITKQATGSDC